MPFSKSFSSDCACFVFQTFCTKLVKQRILENISKCIKDKKVTGNNQHEFSKKKSCMISLIVFYDEMTGLVNEGRTVDFACLDFGKAFNTVSHNTLVDRLMNHQFDESVQAR